MSKKKNSVLNYGTSARCVRKHDLRFGAISLLCVGIAFRVVLSEDFFPTLSFEASLAIVLLIIGWAFAIVGLRRGAASLVLSSVSLAFILYICVGSCLYYAVRHM